MAALISCPYDALPHLLFAAEHFHHATVVAHFRLQQWFLAAASFQMAVDVCFQLFAPTYDCNRNNFVRSICKTSQKARLGNLNERLEVSLINGRCATYINGRCAVRDGRSLQVILVVSVCHEKDTRNGHHYFPNR